MNVGLILSGGRGSRFGSALPKQYHMLNGKMVIAYVADALARANSVDKIVFVGDNEEPALKNLACQYGGAVAGGGKTRNLSLQNGLDFVHMNFDCENIMIFDAVRPMVNSAMIDRYFQLLRTGYDAVITVQEITDSLGCRDCWRLDRSRYYLMQSPEAYRFEMLYKYFDKDSLYTEVLHHMPDTANAYLNFDFTNNIKLTYDWELDYLSALLK